MYFSGQRKRAPSKRMRQAHRPMGKGDVQRARGAEGLGGDRKSSMLRDPAGTSRAAETGARHGEATDGEDFRQRRERLQGHRARGTSTESWEKAVGAAVERASRTLRDLR